MKKTEKISPEIFNVQKEAVEKLASLFPQVVKDGNVDFELLKRELDGTIDDSPEKYRFTWTGKEDARRLANEDVFGRTLKFVPEESKNADTTGNLFIEGDNLEVLKLLRQNYYAAIKMIYIDPPYNTGNDFVYRDNFTQDEAASELEEGNITAEGERLVRNQRSSNRYHANWLNMIYPRLRVARDLLTEDGVIFISIDDNEVANLRKVCDEVFGEQNFVACIVWQKKTAPDARMEISNAHDYILCYAKNTEAKVAFNALEYSEERKASYSNPDNDVRGEWASVDMTGQTGRAPKSQFYEITTPDGTKYLPPDGRCWAMAESTFNELVADNRIWFGHNKNSRPRMKKFLSESEGNRPWTWWDNKFAGHNQDGNKEVMRIFENALVFDNPKPTKLIKQLIRLATTPNAHDTVLDFFGGSATTADAVISLNAEDSGNRKFILIQLPQLLVDEGNGFKASNIAKGLGYKTIADIGKERIRRAGERIVDSFQLSVDRKERLKYGCIKLSRADCLEEINGTNGRNMVLPQVGGMEKVFFDRLLS